MFRPVFLVILAFVLSTPSHAESRRGGPGQMCGGIAGIQCQSGLTCQMPKERRGADIAGTCVGGSKRPEFCTREYRPVCGTDHRTYSNDCERRVAGVGKEHNGPCGRRPR